jgi:hypothetical protein
MRVRVNVARHVKIDDCPAVRNVEPTGSNICGHHGVALPLFERSDDLQPPPGHVRKHPHANPKLPGFDGCVSAVSIEHTVVPALPV